MRSVMNCCVLVKDSPLLAPVGNEHRKYSEDYNSQSPVKTEQVIEMTDLKPVGTVSFDRAICCMLHFNCLTSKKLKTQACGFVAIISHCIYL